MSKMVQIRNVPDALHRRLKARAALEGKSLSDYLLAEIAESAERPTIGELRARLAGRSPVSARAEARPHPARGTQLSVIVVDASAILEVLLRSPAALAIEERLFERGETLHAPHLIDLEVLQVLRRYAAAGEVSAERAREALDDLAAFRLRRWAHDALALRIWELRQNLTAYDAAYIALAEALGAPLLTRDRRLASAPGIRTRVEVA